MVTNDTGTVLWSWNSDAFGTNQQNLDVDGDNVNFPFILRFPGQLFDPESNNHYNCYRDYEPGTGRYLESDPIGLYGGMNTFGYVEGNPNTKFDIFGQQTGAGLIEYSRKEYSRTRILYLTKPKQIALGQSS